MNVPTITMEPEAAQAKLKAFRRELHYEADATYKAAADGYRMLAQGFPLIDINAAIRAGGFDAEGMPRLAVARADEKVVKCDLHGLGNPIEFGPDTWRRVERSRRITVEAESPGYFLPRSRYTRVPMVPADIKQQLRGMNRSTRLHNYHVLWEVDRWYKKNPVEPPVDPYLLKHCGGSLYAVLAEWDLTELERSVMRGLGGR